MEPVKIKPSVDYIETYADFASFAPLPGAEKISFVYILSQTSQYLRYYPKMIYQINLVERICR